MMDSDEDDFYPTHDANGSKGQDEVKMDEMEDGEEGEEGEEEESDDDVSFIIDAKEEPKADPKPQTARPASTVQAASDVRKASETPVPSLRAEPVAVARAESRQPDDRPGTDYEPIRTSKLDLYGNPVHPATGKPILSTDFDSDFPTESSMPWRKPGADITDYFNYGFDEFTWASWCLKQQKMPKEVQKITQEAEQMKAFVEGIPGGGMPGMPPMMPGAGDAGGMPMPNEAQMQAVFAQCMAQGIDPSTMDPMQMMQMMAQASAGPGMMGGQQPPTGPAAGFGGGGGGFDQGGGGGGGGGFGRGGRGKGGRRNW